MRTTGRPLHRRSHSLENGTAAPPGFYGTFLPVVERVDALKGPGGATVAKPDINVVANMAGYSVTTQKKILGAEYGLSVIIPIVNTRFTANLFNASAESGGVSDLYFAPVVLGWDKGNLGAPDTGRCDVLDWQAKTMEHLFPHNLGDQPE
jgi:hypothetical protein